MTEYEIPTHMRLCVDVIRALPLPGDAMTVTAYEDVRRLLLTDAEKRADKPEDTKSEPEKPKADERPTLTAGSHLADSSRAGRRPEPDTTTFGFSRRYW